MALSPEQLELIYAVVIIVGAFVGAKILNYVIKKVLDKLTAKTKTTADDVFMANIRKPVIAVVMLAGLSFALKYITALAPYYGTIDFIVSVAYILVAAVVAMNFFELAFTLYLEKISPKVKTDMDTQLLPIIRSILKVIILVFAVIMIMGKAGYDITPMLAGLGIGGLAIALALQPTLASFIAGFYIIADKPLKVGDYIELSGGTRGYVKEVGWRTTKIRTPSNLMVIIPNSKLADSIITNYDMPTKPLSLIEKINVAYESDIDKVKKILDTVAKKVIKTSEEAIKDFKPIVRLNSFCDSSIEFLVIIRVRERSHMFPIAAKLREEVLREFKKNKISIPYPQMDVHLDK